MRHLALILALAIGTTALQSCSQESGPSEPARNAVEFRFVGPDRMKVHQSADAASPVIAEYMRGEPMSVLARSGAWAEVRVGAGSGWVRASDLVSEVQQKQLEADNTQPRFTSPPPSVADLSARGEIVLEANVNTDGDVVSVKVLRNTTGSPGLEFKNVEALKRAKFTPVVRRGEREPFVYEHRVNY